MAKYKIIPSSRTIVQSPISIGHKAEKGVEAIEFDLTAWVEAYGSGTLTVIMRRWGDEIPYPIALEIDENNKATWTLSDIDTAKAGMAYAQLSYIVGETVVKKSDIYTFRVMDSLTGEGDPPEAYESWLEHLTHIAAEAMAEVLDIEGIVTDKTLTVDGGIADAKSTGDALALKADKSTTYTKTEVDALIDEVEVETDTTLEIAGAPADAAETGRRIGLLKADLNKSGMQLLPVQENQTVTSNGVTFTMTNGVCHAQGTASNTAFIRLYYVDRYHLPDGITPGAIYHVSYETTNVNLRLDFTFYSGGDQLGSVVYFVEDGDIAIPATAEGMMIRLSVAKNMTVNADASNIGIFTSLNNVELTNKVNGLLALTKLEFTFPTTANGYINNSGSLVYNSSFVTTGYIKAEHKIELSGHIAGVSSNLYQINAYDINQAYLGGILAGQATFDDMQVFDLPVGAKYIRITKSINSKRSFDVYCVNDIDYSSEVNYVYSSNIFNVEKSIKGYYVNYNSGKLVSSANYNASDKIRIIPGTEYYISNFEQMAFYDENEIYIGGIYYNNGILKNGDLPLSDDWITATGYNDPMTFVAQSNFAFMQTSITSGRLPFYTIKINSADAGDYAEYYRTIPDLAISGSHIIDSIDAGKVLADVVAKPMTIKLIGDSITAGFKGTRYNATSTGGGVQIDGDVYTNVAGHCWANSLKAYWEEKFPTCTVKNYGWTGLNSATMLQEWPYLVDDDDDVLICTIGTNDRAARSNLAQYIYNLEVIVFRALYAGKKIILMANIPASLANETSGDKNFHMEDVEHAVRYVSNKRRVPFINLFELFTNYCQERDIDMNTLLADGLHPNDDGYDVMFYLITNALGISPKMTGATW